MNKVEIKEENGITTILLNGIKLNYVKAYCITKKDVDTLELTLKLDIDPNESKIELIS